VLVLSTTTLDVKKEKEYITNTICLDRWCSWLTHLPVTQEIAGSSPVRSAIKTRRLSCFYDILECEFYLTCSASALTALGLSPLRVLTSLAKISVLFSAMSAKTLRSSSILFFLSKSINLL
jgi:hypothetical protein